MKKEYVKPTTIVVKLKNRRRLLLVSGEETRGGRYYRDETEDPENAL